MPPANRGTTQNAESQRRGAANTSTSRTQGKTVPVSSARNTGRSSTTSTSQRQSAKSAQGTGQTRSTQGVGQTQAAQGIGQTQSVQDRQGSLSSTQAQTSTQGQTSTPQPDRELPVQSSRETTQPNVGQGIGRSTGQNTPVYGGYGNYGGAVGNPFVAIRRMMEDMDRFVSNFGFGANLFPPSLFSQDPFGIPRATPQSAGGIQTLWNPDVEVFQRGDRVVVRADLPGLKKEDVNVEIDQNTLTIRGERRHEFENVSEGIYRSERSYGTFQRSIPLPEGITADDAQASFNDGVLEVTLPAPKNQARVRRVQIR